MIASITERRFGFAAACAVLLLCTLAELSSAAAQTDSRRRLRQYRRPWRSGVVSFGLQGQGGYNAGETPFTEHFGWGPGMAITFRYAVSRHVSVGARFEAHNFGADVDSMRAPEVFHGSVDLQAVDSERIWTAGGDIYFYLNRTKETMYYFNGGVGMYQLAILQPEQGYLHTQSARIESDSVYLMGGVGLEHFLRRSVSFDLNGKVFAYLGDKDGLPTSIQVAAGLQLYFFD